VLEVALRLVVFHERVERARVVVLQMVRLAVVLDRVVVALLSAHDLAELQERVEMAAVALQYRTEVPQRFVVPTLEDRGQAAPVLLLDLLVRALVCRSRQPSIILEASR